MQSLHIVAKEYILYYCLIFSITDCPSMERCQKVNAIDKIKYPKLAMHLKESN